MLKIINFTLINNKLLKKSMWLKNNSITKIWKFFIN